MPDSKRLDGKQIVKKVPWGSYRHVIKRLRDLVFVNEQGIDADIVHDDGDSACTHFVIEDNGEAIACGRLQTSGKVERMAVLLPYRNHRVGAELLEFMKETAREQGMEYLYLHAQLPAVNFYLRGGFDLVGDQFEEAGIAHQEMRLSLDDPSQGFISGVDYPQPFAHLSLKLANSARRELRIYSAQLDHDVFDNEAWISAIARVVRRSPEARVRILITDSEAIVNRGHRLLNVSRRLSSSVSIRKISEHPEINDDCFVVRDTDGIIFNPEETFKKGFYEPASRASSQQFIERFDQLWEISEVDPELRQLSL